jgi:hypothetical protein
VSSAVSQISKAFQQTISTHSSKPYALIPAKHTHSLQQTISTLTQPQTAGACHQQHSHYYLTARLHAVVVQPELEATFTPHNKQTQCTNMAVAARTCMPT